VPYLSASAVVIHYEEALYQVYAPLRYLYLTELHLIAVWQDILGGPTKVKPTYIFVSKI